MTVDIQTLRRGVNQRIRRSADGHDNHIGVQHELGTGNFHRTTATRSIRFRQHHTHALHTAYPALVVADNLHWIGKQLEVNTFLLGVVYFLATSRQLLLGTAIDDVDFGTETDGCTSRIHGHVAATYHRHLLTNEVRSFVMLLVREQQVVSRQKLISGDHTA